MVIFTIYQDSDKKCARKISLIPTNLTRASLPLSFTHLLLPFIYADKNTLKIAGKIKSKKCTRICGAPKTPHST